MYTPTASVQPPGYFISFPGTIIYTSCGYDQRLPRSKAEKRLQEQLREFEDNVSKLSVSLRKEEKARQAMLDARSRQRRPHPSTGRDQHRRLQTYDAAMAMRQLRR